MMFDWFQKRGSGAFDLTMAPIPVAEGGFLSGTHVASNLGWRPIEALCEGDMMLTFDHGMQPIIEMQREVVHVEEGVLDPLRCPLYIPRDALNNRVPMSLMPDQGVLLESDLIEDPQGDPFAVVPACTLEGYRGISRMHTGEKLELIRPRFARDEVVYLEAGLLAFCSAPGDLLNMGAPVEDVAYKVLPVGAARELVQAMTASENMMLQNAAASMPPGTYPI